jgi:hypothetical protein
MIVFCFRPCFLLVNVQSKVVANSCGLHRVRVRRRNRQNKNELNDLNEQAGVLKRAEGCVASRICSRSAKKTKDKTKERSKRTIIPLYRVEHARKLRVVEKLTFSEETKKKRE